MAPTAPPNTLGVVTLEKARKNTGPKGCNHKAPTYKLESSGPQGTFKPLEGMDLLLFPPELMLASLGLAALNLAILFYISMPCISLSC